jgi:hypothetical protein
VASAAELADAAAGVLHFACGRCSSKQQQQQQQQQQRSGRRPARGGAPEDYSELRGYQRRV